MCLEDSSCCKLMEMWKKVIKMDRRKVVLSSSLFLNVALLIVLCYTFRIPNSAFDASKEAEVLQTPECMGKACSQVERLTTLRNACQKYPEISQGYDPEDSSMYQNFIVDDHHRIIICTNPKAASTTFRNVFYYAVTGRHLPPSKVQCIPCLEKEGLVHLKKFPKEERDRRLKDYSKYMVVRHPMDRLVSAWNDKFSLPHKHPLWQSAGPEMIKMFRQVPEGSTMDKEIEKGATFEEFVKYVNHVEVLAPRAHDHHWDRLHHNCHPCSIDYDAILKVETLNRDSKIILDKLALNASDFLVLHSKRSNGEERLNLHKTVEEYRNIEEGQLMGIKQLYAVDMEAFRYKWNDDSLEASCGGSCDDEDHACC